MHAVDRWFVRLVDANPALRPRVGNPDELRSNHMGATLGRLRHRVDVPEAGVADAVDGAVITALNEAVAAAAPASKGGINLIVGYETFPMKRSEERRVGKECVSTCRVRWWPDPE